MEKLTKCVNGEVIELSDEEEAEVRAQWAENEAKAQKIQYAKNRKSEYPAIQDQLDHIFHNGLDSWKQMIQSIKDKHPKPIS